MKEVKYNPIYRLVKSKAGEMLITLSQLAKKTGIPYQTLLYRLRNPGTWKLCELAIVTRFLDFSPEDWEKLREEVEKL